MDEGLVDSVIHGLSRHRSRSEIIMDVCARGGLRWQEAEQFVQRLEVERRGTIERKQAPIQIFLSLGLMIIGAIMLFIFNYGISVFQVLLLEELFGPRTTMYEIASGVVGGGLSLAGLIGLWRIARRIRTSRSGYAGAHHPRTNPGRRLARTLL